MAKTQTSVRVVAILPDNLAICQQIYTQPPLPQTSTGIAFKKMDELYHFLANARTMPDRWLMTDAATLQVTTQTDTLKLALKAVTDPLEMLRVAVLRASVNGGGDSKQQDLSGIQQ